MAASAFSAGLGVTPLYSGLFLMWRVNWSSLGHQKGQLVSVFRMSICRIGMHQLPVTVTQSVNRMRQPLSEPIHIVRQVLA